MADSDPKHYFVSFERISASVGGTDISSIVELRLVAAANSVPQVTLLVDVGDGESVRSVSLANARRVFDMCRSKLRTDAATLSLSLVCVVKGSGSSETRSSLSLNGWLLTDVSLSPVQRGGICTASLTFMHPICKAQFGGVIPGLLANDSVSRPVEDATPLSVFTRALRNHVEAKRMESLPISVPGAASPTTMRAQLLDRLSKAISDLEASVRWTHGRLPAHSYFAAWGSALSQAIADYVSPNSGNSVLQALLGSIVPECSLALGGDYTQDKLELGPFEPWASPAFTLTDSDIVSLDLPQSDPTPISGVRIVMSSSGVGMGATYLPLGCQDKDAAFFSEIFYVPDSETKAPYLYGPIQQFEEPSWLVRVIGASKPRDATMLADTELSGNGLYIATGVPLDGGVAYGDAGEGGTARSEYASAVLACAKAYFETSLMKDWTFTVESRLMFSTGEGTICPGKVMGVMSGGTEVLGGYVVGVEHVISVPSRSAVTRVTCTHPRFGSLPSAVTSSKNALYT